MKKTSFLIVIILFMNCSEDNSILNFLENLEPFQGITETLKNGTVVSEDTTDWYYKHATYPRLSNALFPVYPNPIFVGDTLNIKFQLENRSQVKLEIINNKYRTVKVIIEQELVGGHYWQHWDLKNDDGVLIKPDMYKCVLQVNQFRYSGDILVK